MKLFSLLLLIFLIANSFNIIECSDVNITLSCSVLSSTDSDKNDYDVICILPDGLNNTLLTEVRDVEVKDEKFLKTINLRFNSTRMPYNMPRKIGKKFTNLKKFELTATSLKYISKLDFEGMEGLKVLDLSSNDIEIIPQDTFSNLINLEVLYIYSNNISNLPQYLLNNLPKLKEFHADGNKIDEIVPNFFLKNLEIEKISLNDNRLISIKENFTAYKNLEYVDLRRNFRHCTACPIVSSDKMVKILNDCVVDKIKSENKATQDYLECAKGKLTEKDNFTKIYDNCENAKINSTNVNKKNIDNCSVVDKKQIIIEKMGELENCTYSNLNENMKAIKEQEKCIDSQAEKYKDMKDLLQNCRNNRTVEVTKKDDDYDSCTYCVKTAADDGFKKCEIRYVKYYEDSFEDFISDVAKFFGVVTKN